MRWQAFCANGRARRLAERVVDDHGTAPRLDAANIGQAAVSVVRNPNQWQDWGSPPEVLQHLKDLWTRARRPRGATVVGHADTNEPRAHRDRRRHRRHFRRR